MKLPLSYYGNPILREPAESVEAFDEALRELAGNMVETMHAESGIGLAGPQVGRGLRIFVMEIPADMDVDAEGKRVNPELSGPLTVINPEIEWESKELEEMEEGCLSIPDVRGKVRRAVGMGMRFQDVEGKEREVELRGLAARCALHETDHLNGVLFVDHLSQVKRVAIRGKLRRIKEKYA